MLTIAQTLLAESQKAQRQRSPETAEEIMRSRQQVVLEQVQKNLPVLFELRFGATLMQAALEGHQFAELPIAELTADQFLMDWEVRAKLSNENRALFDCLPQFLEDQGFYWEQKIVATRAVSDDYRTMGVPTGYKVSLLVRW